MSIEQEVQQLQYTVQNNLNQQTDALRELVQSIQRFEIRLLAGKHFATKGSGIVKITGPGYNPGQVMAIGANEEQYDIPLGDILNEVPELKGVVHTGQKNGVNNEEV